MAERGYFTFRYAIPGYAFILLVIIVNYVPLLKILEIMKTDAAFGAFLAFLSLFAGSALGFLISQIWWLWFKSTNCNIFGIKELEPIQDAFIQVYHLPEKFKGKKEALGAILDFIFHLHRDERMLKLAERRWDSYHVLSSTLLTLILGWVLGIFFRIYYEIFLFNSSFSIYCNLSFWAEFLAQLFIFVCVLVLLCAILIGRHRLMIEYLPILNAFIRHTSEDVRREDLERVFPDYF